jgi:hypothetical protein
MKTILIILAIGLILATAVALVRGIIAFLQSTEAELKSESSGPSANQLKQNAMMRNRIIFQGLAILVLALLLLLGRSA